jgi:uncharacterized protein (TIGR02996 family)
MRDTALHFFASAPTVSDWTISAALILPLVIFALIRAVVDWRTRRRHSGNAQTQRGQHQGQAVRDQTIQGRPAGAPSLQMPAGGGPSRVGGAGGPIPVPGYGDGHSGDADASIVERIPVPDSWERGPGATFRGGNNGLWLHVNQAGVLAYTNRYDVERPPGQREDPVVIVSVPAGQLVRVVDSRVPDDEMGHVPTIRADRAEVRSSALDTAVPVEVLPGPDVVCRVFKRPAEEAAFWNAMIVDPEDDLPVLVYADWLDDRGDPAAGILRGITPLLLHSWVGVGDRWECRDQMTVAWRPLLSRLAPFENGPGYRHFELQPGNAGPLLEHFQFHSCASVMV